MNARQRRRHVGTTNHDSTRSRDDHAPRHRAADVPPQLPGGRAPVSAPSPSRAARRPQPPPAGTIGSRRGRPERSARARPRRRPLRRTSATRSPSRPGRTTTSQEVLDDFTAATGVAINVSVYGSTEEMEAKIRAGNSGIDVVVPSNYAIEGWVADNAHRAARLRRSCPDFVKADWNALFMDQAFDKGNAALDPQELGHHRHRLLELEGQPWPSRAGRTSSTGRHDVRGQGPDRRPPDQLVRLGGGGHGLLAQHDRSDRDGRRRGDAHRPSSPSFSPSRRTSSRRCAQWTRGCRSHGPATACRSVRDNPDDAKYVVASDGGELWIDSYTVAADAPHQGRRLRVPQLHHSSRHQAAAETEFCLFPHANDKATALLDPARQEQPGRSTRPADLLAKLEYAVNATYNSPERAEAWARIKASA